MNLTQPSERFDTLAEAEDTLKHQGFKLVPDTCDWIDEAGLIDAGVYPVEEAYRIEYRTLKGKRGVMAGPSHTHVDATSRRRFLFQAAGVAACGAVVALATVSASADAAAPVAAPASSGVDPIFALIDEYRAAAKTVAAAASEHDQREEMLIEQGLGSSPFISVPDMRQFGGSQPVVVWKHEYVDIHIPPDRFSKVNAAAHASLDAKMEQHKAILGDSEDVLNAAQDAETEAVDTLVWTPPTTIAGVLALLELFPELRRARVLGDDQADTIIISAIDALDDIHPNARLANVGAV